MPRAVIRASKAVLIPIGVSEELWLGFLLPQQPNRNGESDHQRQCQPDSFS